MPRVTKKDQLVRRRTRLMDRLNRLDFLESRAGVGGVVSALIGKNPVSAERKRRKAELAHIEEELAALK